MRSLSCFILVTFLTTVSSSLLDKLGKTQLSELVKTEFEKKGLDDIFDKEAFDKFEELFKDNKTHEFIDNLKGLSEKTKKSLKLSTEFRQKLKPDDSKNFNKFFGFIAKFEKEYHNDTHVSESFKKFQSTLKRIEERQKESPKAKFGVNQFSDLTPEEFIAKHTGIKGVEHLKQLHGNINSSKLLRSKRDTTQIPSNFDWRENNGVTAVQNQGGCACCYAFSAVGVIESQHLIHTGQTLHLSEEQVIACTNNVSKYHNHGCNGGTAPGVLDYVIENGITLADNFKFTSGDGDHTVPACPSGKPYATKVTKEEFLPSNDEDNLAKVVYEVGPIATYIDAGGIQDYKSGILDVAEPSGGWGINHGVVIVGYGEENGTKYWIFKNSWGPGWGDQGFFKLKRGVNSLNMAQFNWAAYF
ncbi:unnamed protein product [Bursaphelenchus xylophilus]|uniref:(pine wood nematode) hypothetical protein n=1 Tax=Bursaphelenchus xylophilus TaxID=6326 RepID=A0A1I7S4I3_BURXY|nr:unnamed protein product [Bursaphelenchus xylophilus]CAG9117126.1 unnamed protein product [Bursaphelenchus xylophilus]